MFIQILDLIKAGIEKKMTSPSALLVPLKKIKTWIKSGIYWNCNSSLFWIKGWME